MCRKIEPLACTPSSQFSDLKMEHREHVRDSWRPVRFKRLGTQDPSVQARIRHVFAAAKRLEAALASSDADTRISSLRPERAPTALLLRVEDLPRPSLRARIFASARLAFGRVLSCVRTRANCAARLSTQS